MYSVGSITIIELLLFCSKAFTQGFEASCSSLANSLAVDDLGTLQVYSSEFYPAGSTVFLLNTSATCLATLEAISQSVTADICRVTMSVSTSSSSSINMEAWLPSNWTGRFVTLGNGGLDGCIDYQGLDYGSSLGFATVGANGGHNGTSGEPFFNAPEVIDDFSWRSVHTSAVVGKEVTQQLYGSPITKSYYLSCSTGGRQGFKEVQDFPEDFDGVVAGAPAIAFNGLNSFSINFYRILGNALDPTFVNPLMWGRIHDDILKQCDLIDGALDGIIENSDLCDYNPDDLLCNATTTSDCLTETQAGAVHEVFSPVLAPNGTLIYPRMPPGSELLARVLYYNSIPFPPSADWFKYAVYNNPDWDSTSFSLQDAVNAVDVNPGNVQTWNGDLSAFQARGGKLLTWHGQQDMLISAENSERYYNFVSQTMNLTSSQLDDFYRFYRVGGMSHCVSGPGASAIGQLGGSSFAGTSPQDNILMAAVDWVENGNAPDTIRGTKFVDDDPTKGVDFTRKHCRYPFRNKYHGTENGKDEDGWTCVADST